jgi:dephospho-CoA kinase
MLVIGLTGGIGSGKSTVAAHFARLGVPVIDADAIARALVAYGQPALDEVIAAFGADLRRRDGTLDRARLRRLVLADPERRRRLEAILHPRIRAEMTRRLGEIEAPYCILSIPLLVETGQSGLVDRILVVDCPESLQRGRIAARNDWTTDEIDAMIAAQATRDQRRQAADDVLVNDSDLDTLHRNIEDLHRRYLELSG